MTVVVNDASCLIDLHKGRLIDVMLTLPYRFEVPLPVRYAEALDFDERGWQHLAECGLVTSDLPPERLARAMSIKTAHPRLPANNCICLVSALCHEHGILLTGDRTLRRVAIQNGVRYTAYCGS